MKVVITGGTGFVGTRLARKILDKGTLAGPSGKQEPVDEIVLFDIALPAALPEGLDGRVSMRQGEISDKATVDALIDRPDIGVFHLASVVSGGGEKDFDLAMRVNLDGGRYVLEATSLASPRTARAMRNLVTRGHKGPLPAAETTAKRPAAPVVKETMETAR